MVSFEIVVHLVTLGKNAYQCLVGPKYKLSQYIAPMVTIIDDPASDQIPGVRSTAWKEVANQRRTNLTMAIVEGSGGDQMSILHTRTVFSEKVSIDTYNK